MRLLTVFALPILAGQLLQNLYHSVDSIVVGRFVSTTALAAVSSCGNISQLLVGFFTGLSVGSGVLFSRYFGAKDYKNLHDSIHTALTLSMILGLVMALFGILLSPWLIKITDCPADVVAEATVYLQIYFAGTLFTSIYNVGASILRSVGDSKDPFIYLLISSITNIVLDLAFVAWLQMGVMGVALATVISQILSVILVFRNMLITEDVYKIRFAHMKMNRSILAEILELGLPAAIQSSLTAMSHLMTQRYINSFGAAGMAGIGAGTKVDKFSGLATNSIALALTTFISQNLGAKKPERAFKAIRVSLMLCGFFIVALGLPIYYKAEFVIRIFTEDPDALAYGVQMIKLMVPLFAFQAVFQVYSNALRGFGRSRVTMMLSLMGMLVIRQIYLAVFMKVAPSPAALILCFPVGWISTCVLILIYYTVKIYLPYRKTGKVN